MFNFLFNNKGEEEMQEQNFKNYKDQKPVQFRCRCYLKTLRNKFDLQSLHGNAKIKKRRFNDYENRSSNVFLIELYAFKTILIAYEQSVCKQVAYSA